MKIIIASCNGRSGYALATVLLLTGVSLYILSSAMNWASSTSRLNDRNNEYFTTVAAGESALEKISVEIARDQIVQGETGVYKNLSKYQMMVPTVSEESFWKDYEFRSPDGKLRSTLVTRPYPAAFTTLDSKYSRKGFVATYYVISNVRNSRNNVQAGVGSALQLIAEPLFQFAIFYGIDLEINPGPAMTVSGRVHSNGSIYTSPGASLSFQGDVTAVKAIQKGRMPGDPETPGSGSVQFSAAHDGDAMPIKLPVVGGLAQDSVHDILEPPPAKESEDSELGRLRYYNKADVVVTVSDKVVSVEVGLGKDKSLLKDTDWRGFLRTNVSFFNKREKLTVQATEVDVSKLRNNLALQALLGRDPEIVYVVDNRTGGQPSVRLVNGEVLPQHGLSVATPNPLYVVGDYNVSRGGLSYSKGSTNTANTLPASLAADAITILSSSWNDTNSTASLSYRKATNTTVNAAFLAGIVPTQNNIYSGGVENFPRFLEDWSSSTLTYNGSMVVLFPSEKATGPWKGTDIYNPPTRKWTFDANFLNPDKLPPGSPMAKAVIHAKWTLLAPGVTQF